HCVVRVLALFSPSFFSFFFIRTGAPRDLHSFPTRRSSDLASSRPVTGSRIPTAESRSSRSGTSTSAATARSARPTRWRHSAGLRSEEHTSELQSRFDLVCRLLLEKKKKK